MYLATTFFDSSNSSISSRSEGFSFRIFVAITCGDGEICHISEAGKLRNLRFEGELPDE